MKYKYSISLKSLRIITLATNLNKIKLKTYLNQNYKNGKGT